MTPFHIRDRLKKLLGMGGGAASPAPKEQEVPRYTVTYLLPDGGSYQAKGREGDTLVLISNRGPQPIATGCADGTCSTCRVEVILAHDQLTPETEHERNTKRTNNCPMEYRLGCQTGVLGEGVKVKIINVLGAMDEQPPA